MENQAKIISIVLLFLLLFNFSCNTRSNCNIKNKSLLLKVDSLNNLVLVLKEYYMHNRIEFIKINGKLHKLGEIIHCNSFRNIYDDLDSITLGNEYYRANPIASYFKDKNYIYFYTGSNYLTVKGKSNQYEVLGGPYLRIDNKIYYEGKEVIGADISSFKVIHAGQKDSGWLRTVGLDNKYIYNSENKMNELMFEHFRWDNKDSLKQIYFDTIE